MRYSSPSGRPSILLWLLVLTAFVALPSGIHAQAPNDEPSPPPYYAITNARIVTVSGPVIERGTVVIANGVIQAVGTNVTIPPEAWVIDGEGLTVYPGLIDALSDVALTSEENGQNGARPGAGGRPGGNAPSADGPEDRPATFSWRTAADGLTTDDSRIETWRAGGFTSVMTVPASGIVTGQGAVINLRDDNPQEMVVRTPAAMRLNLEGVGGFRSYPGSLFGVISYIEQVFLDANRYGQALAADQARPAGMDRPAYDRTLDPLRRAIAEQWPVLIPAVEEREIRRAMELGQKIGVRTTIYGAHEGYELASELASAGTTVLVSLEWPERSKDADPESEESLRSLRKRAWAPSTPKAFHDAGVRFAFYSGGIATPREALQNVKKAIDEGLPQDAALRALTLGAAQVYGVSDRLGSIERGKLANLTVADGDLFEEKTKVKMVFVDGRKYEKREAGRPTEAPATDVTGSWTVTVQTPRGTQESTAELTMETDGTLSGKVRGERGEGSITEGWVSGTRFNFTVQMTMGGRSVQASYTGTTEGDEMEGSVSFGRFSSEFTAAKTAGAAPAVAAAPEAQPDTPTPAARTAAMPPRAAGPMHAMVNWDAPPPTLAITNATIMTVTRGTITGGTVLVRDGKITAVGTDVRVPGGATVIDASGKYVTPGIVDAHSHIATDAVNEGSIAVSSMVRIEDVVDPSDINIYREAAGGVTTSHVMHGSANPIGGQNAIIKHRWGQDAEGLRFQGAPPTIKFALGENPKRSNFNLGPGTERRYPNTRMGVMDVIRRAFLDAREYKQKWDEFERRQRAGERNLVPPARDLKLDPLVEIMEGTRLVHAHSYRADEILQLMRLAEEFGFKITAFQHVLEGYKVADEIAAHGAGASTFSDWWAYKVEAYDAIPYNAALMTQRGVLVSINSDSPEEARHLNQEAGKTMKWGGLSETEALSLVTINPAKQLRIDDRVGSIEVGKDADLVVWENHPLSSYAKTLTTIVDGRVVFDIERDRERQDRITGEKDELKGKLGESNDRGAGSNERGQS